MLQNRFPYESAWHPFSVSCTDPSRIVSLIEVTLGAGSFSFGLYYWPLGATAAGGGALARREEAAVGGTLARREEEAVGGTLAPREEAEEPGELRGPPAVAPLVSEPAAGQEVYVQPGAQEPEYA